MPQLCLAEVRVIVQLGKERTVEEFKYCFFIGGKLWVYMGHGVNSEGTERGIRGTRISIAVEWGRKRRS